ncbi:MAG: type II toxin-antitoxin system RelE/ParE family toxin [Janthinobacterium lividum]
MTSTSWTARTTAAAQRDFADIVERSGRTFGPAQARRYRVLLIDALVALQSGPRPLGSFGRDAIAPGFRVLPMSRAGRRGRHLLVYRPVGPDIIEVVRILHDRMDLARHIPPSGST